MGTGYLQDCFSLTLPPRVTTCPTKADRVGRFHCHLIGPQKCDFSMAASVEHPSHDIWRTPTLLTFWRTFKTWVFSQALELGEVWAGWEYDKLHQWSMVAAPSFFGFVFWVFIHFYSYIYILPLLLSYKLPSI